MQVGEVTEECLGMAWVTFESLEKSIAAATSSAAKAVNRNHIGYKRYNFRPLRYFIYCAILFHKYTHICFQRIAFNVYQKLGDVPAVFEGTRFANCAFASVISKIVTHQVQDANAEKNSHDLLEEALKDPVHAEEPAVVKFMVYLHAFVPTFKDVDVFQVGCNENILFTSA